MISLAAGRLVRHSFATKPTNYRQALYFSVKSFSTVTTSENNSITKSTNESNFSLQKEPPRALFKFQDSAFAYDQSSAPKPEPPEPPKDFAKAYGRRPLYGFALEGNSKFFVLFGIS